MPTRYTHLINCADMVLRADRAEIDHILERWASGQQVTINNMTKALADLINYLDDAGMDTLIELVETELAAEHALLGVAAGLSAAEIKSVPDTDDDRARLATLAGLRGHHVG